MKTTAAQIRTGHVITNPYAQPRELEVAYTVRERFTSPEGVTNEVVRFSGWQGDTWVEAGWGQPLDGRVSILRDVRGPWAFGAVR